jgi:hypothetical protein
VEAPDVTGPAATANVADVGLAVQSLREVGIEALWGPVAQGEAVCTAFTALYLRCRTGLNVESLHRLLTDSETAQQRLRDLGIADITRVCGPTDPPPACAADEVEWSRVLEVVGEDVGASEFMWSMLAPTMGQTDLDKHQRRGDCTGGSRQV